MQKHPDCSKTLTRVDAWVDGDLPSAERAALEAHLAACSECASEAALARRVADELRALPELSCPPVLSRAVLDRATGGEPLGERWRRLLRRFGGEPGAWGGRLLWQPALALALAVAVGVSWWSRDEASLGVARPAVDVAPRAFSDAEIAAAETELKLALAYLGEISQKAGSTFGDEVSSRVLEPVTRSLTGALLPVAQPPGSVPREDRSGAARPQEGDRV